MIYITGDCHANFHKFSTQAFPEQKEMSRDDMVIVCGDFGIWHNNPTEKYWLDWLSKKSFTIAFVDGNHENFDRLYGDEFEVVDFHGGKAHKIRENVYHLMRGYVFEFEGKKFFAFGGARSHDIDDGVLDAKDYDSVKEMIYDYNRRSTLGEMLRINHISWWEEEMPSKEEMDFGIRTLKEHNNQVDFIVTHCCPTSIAAVLLRRKVSSDELTQYFEELASTVAFNKWIFGHYHDDREIYDKYILLYDQIVRIV